MPWKLKLQILNFFPAIGAVAVLSISQNLQQLELLQVDITDEFFLDFDCKFPHLEHLEIHLYRRLQKIKNFLPSNLSFALYSNLSSSTS